MSRPTCSRTAERAAENASTTPPSRCRPSEGCAAMRASFLSWTVRTASRSASGGAPAASRRRYGADSQAATAGAVSPAAPPRSACTAITSSTGPTAGRPRSTTCRPAVSDPSSAGARGRIRCAAARRRRVSIHQPVWVDHPTTEEGGDVLAPHHRHPERLPRAPHRLRDCRSALAWRAHRLRPCPDGRDGVVGFGRYSSGGGTGGRRLEYVIGEVGRRLRAGMQRRRGNAATECPEGFRHHVETTVAVAGTNQDGRTGIGPTIGA